MQALLARLCGASIMDSSLGLNIFTLPKGHSRMQSVGTTDELITCTNPHCAYQWKPKVKDPKSCPKMSSVPEEEAYGSGKTLD
jgi:hypothetical protein